MIIHNTVACSTFCRAWPSFTYESTFLFNYFREQWLLYHWHVPYGGGVQECMQKDMVLICHIPALKENTWFFLSRTCFSFHRTVCDM